MENNGMIDKTDMEKRAIKDARRFLAEVLTELDLMAPFHDRSAARHRPHHRGLRRRLPGLDARASRDPLGDRFHFEARDDRSISITARASSMARTVHAGDVRRASMR